MSHKGLNTSRAYTLVELLAVLTVLGLVFAFALPQFFSTTIGGRSAAQQFVSFWNQKAKEASLTTEPVLIGFPVNDDAVDDFALRRYTTFRQEEDRWVQSEAWRSLPEEFYFLESSSIAYRPPFRIRTLHETASLTEVWARIPGTKEDQVMALAGLVLASTRGTNEDSGPVAFAIGRGEIDESGAFQAIRGSGASDDESEAQLILIHPETQRARLVEIER